MGKVRAARLREPKPRGKRVVLGTYSRLREPEPRTS